MAIVIGCDFHSRFQVVVYLDEATGELVHRSLQHREEAERFYRGLAAGAEVGVESSQPCRWFQHLLQDCGHRLRVGHAQAIAARRSRRQKHDRADAELIWTLLRGGDFPDVWQPSDAVLAERSSIEHRHQLVRARTAFGNQLKALARSEGALERLNLKTPAGVAALRAVALPPWSERRRDELLDLYRQVDGGIRPREAEVMERSRRDPVARRLATHPGVGPLTAVYFPLVIGDPRRFQRGRQVVSYLGLNPAEYSSGGRQRLGGISKQGNALLRFLLVEAAGHVRKDPELHRFYCRLLHRKGPQTARVAVARKLAMRLWLMWLHNMDYAEWLNRRAACSDARGCDGVLTP